MARLFIELGLLCDELGHLLNQMVNSHFSF